MDKLGEWLTGFVQMLLVVALVAGAGYLLVTHGVPAAGHLIATAENANAVAATAQAAAQADAKSIGDTRASCSAAISAAFKKGQSAGRITTPSTSASEELISNADLKEAVQ